MRAGILAAAIVLVTGCGAGDPAAGDPSEPVADSHSVVDTVDATSNGTP